MTKAIRKRLAGDEGFTLIELMVVVMIIAVLIAIAIPSFLGFRRSAQDRAAQSEIRSVLLSEKAFWLENAAYTETDTDITDFEPNSVIDADPTVGVSLDQFDDGTVCIQRTSDSGTTFGVWESATEGTYYGDNGDLGLVACAAAAPVDWAQGGW
jgi:type IV pilus assembly protein PilA